MTDILITFEDGTTELRDDKSPLLVRRRLVGHERVFTPVEHVVDVRPYFSDGWGMWLVTVADRMLDMCAATVELSARRGDRGCAWRITGGRGKGEPLTGAWAACRVESVAEQIERLTRERDADKARATACEKRFRAFVREIATGYDHEEDAHRHRNGACRVCNAEKLAAELGFEIEEDAR